MLPEISLEYLFLRLQYHLFVGATKFTYIKVIFCSEGDFISRIMPNVRPIHRVRLSYMIFPFAVYDLAGAYAEFFKEGLFFPHNFLIGVLRGGRKETSSKYAKHVLIFNNY